MVLLKKRERDYFLNSQKNETRCCKCCFFYASKVKAKESQVCKSAYNLNIEQKYKDRALQQ